MYGTCSKSFLLAGFDVSGVEPSSYSTSVLVS
jgi:hypothetical protein